MHGIDEPERAPPSSGRPDDVRDDAPHVADIEAQELASDEPTLDDRHHAVDHIAGHLEAGFVNQMSNGLSSSLSDACIR